MRKKNRQLRETLYKCAATTLSSKLLAPHKGFFAKMAVDAVMLLDELLPLKMIGIKKVIGGAIEVRFFFSNGDALLRGLRAGFCFVFAKKSSVITALE